MVSLSSNNEFSLIIDDNSCVKCCILIPKLSQLLQKIYKPDITASYGRLLDFLVFFTHSYLLFISKVLYLHQTFTDCVSNKDILIY